MLGSVGPCFAVLVVSSPNLPGRARPSPRACRTPPHRWGKTRNAVHRLPLRSPSPCDPHHGAILSTLYNVIIERCLIFPILTRLRFPQPHSPARLSRSASIQPFLSNRISLAGRYRPSCVAKAVPSLRLDGGPTDEAFSARPLPKRRLISLPLILQPCLRPHQPFHMHARDHPVPLHPPALIWSSPAGQQDHRLVKDGGKTAAGSV